MGDEIELTPEQEEAAEAAWDETARKKTAEWTSKKTAVPDDEPVSAPEAIPEE